MYHAAQNNSTMIQMTKYLIHYHVRLKKEATLYAWESKLLDTVACLLEQTTRASCQWS